jgi:cytochrome c
MSSCPRVFATLSIAAAALAAAAQPASGLPGIGRPATPQEIAAWDIDVRPDFKGLPPGRGSVAQGQLIWEAQCASCHGIFGESNEVFSPLVGGTTAEDVKRGRVARLSDPGYPGRTTLMKLSTVSTLWDYIYRAMPWTAPKTLKPDEVYAVTAFLLNLGGVLPDDFVLSQANIASVQARLPNRDGKRNDHAMWPGRSLAGTQRKPDVQGRACMKDCEVEPKVASYLPDHARNAHGNLAEQNRAIGAQRGADTSRPAGATPGAGVAAGTAAAATADPHAAALALARKNNCLSCHGLDNRVLGPSLREVAARYAQRGDAADYLAGRIMAGSSGVWGAVAMPAQAVSAAEARTLAEWFMSRKSP